MENFYTEVESLIKHVKSSRLADGANEILVPGEPEFRTAKLRKKKGIAVDEKTWEFICDEARYVNINPDQWKIDDK